MRLLGLKNRIKWQIWPLLFWILPVLASDDFLNRMDTATWSFKKVEHSCLLGQYVSGFGDFLFMQRLAQPLAVQLTSRIDLEGINLVRLSLQSTPWKLRQPEQVMEANLKPIRGWRGAYQISDVGVLLDGLRQGSQLRVTLANPHSLRWVDVVVQPVRLEESLQQFTRCQLALAQEVLPKPVVVKKVAEIQHKKIKKLGGNANPKALTVSSPYQEWLKKHEATKHPLVVSRGRSKSELPANLTMMFAPGKPSISKALQDDMESMVKEWEIRQGEGRGMSLMIEEDATADSMKLVKQRLDAIHAYLVARGISAFRLHMKINTVSSAAHVDSVNVTVGN